LKLASSRNLALALIAVPWVLAAVYLWLLAADRYVAESVVAVRENGETPIIGADALTRLFVGNGAASRSDELLLEAYVLSNDMLKELDAALDLRRSFGAPRYDLLFRLPPNATQERFFDYYLQRVEALVDDNSGLLRIRTQAFTPEAAQAINQKIIEISERFINESSHRLAREQMAFAESELDKARKHVNDARDALLAFQAEHGVLDPVAQASANTGLTVELQASLSRQEAELKSLLGYLNDDSHQVRGLRAQIDGTRAQLETESRRAMTGKHGTSLNVLAGQFQELAANLTFAQDTYKLALTGVETARVESTRKLKSLVLIESPDQPQSARYPQRIYSLIALLMGLGLLYGIVSLVVATIEDHQE
jgi:capsular polysaccharide transport system permease protein